MQVRLMTVCCVLSLSLTAMAQMGADAAKAPAAGTNVTPAVAMDSALSLIEGEMMGAVKAMPADKFSFAPSASIFVPAQNTEFKTVRTFGQQVAHVAQANYFFFMTLSGLKPDVDMKAIGSLTSKDDAVAALAGSFAFGHKAIATLTAANAFEVLKVPEPGIQTRSTLAGFAISHANDHYGQMIEYLRMNGIVPPASAR
jgi:uncharacterized damage-inducible protein DinB